MMAEFEFDLIGWITIAAAAVTILTMAIVYYGYKFFHEPEVILWLERHGIVEIDDEVEER